jgi:hypothetical protein
MTATTISNTPRVCPICQNELSDNGPCYSCGCRFNVGTPEHELLRHMANNMWRIRKHVVFWSIFSAIIMSLGLVALLITVASR